MPNGKKNHQRGICKKLLKTKSITKLSPATVQHYQILLDKGLNEQRAKESLAYFYEVYLRQNPRHSEDFKEETWLDFLNQVPVKLHNGEYSF